MLESSSNDVTHASLFCCGNDAKLIQDIPGPISIQVYAVSATGTHHYLLCLYLHLHAHSGELRDADGDTVNTFSWNNEMVTISITQSQRGILSDSAGQTLYEGEWHDDLPHGVGVYRFLIHSLTNLFTHPLIYSLTHSLTITHSLIHVGTQIKMCTKDC